MILLVTAICLFFPKALGNRTALSLVAQKAAGVYLGNTSTYAKIIVATASNFGYVNHLHNFKCFMDRLAMKVLVFAFDDRTFNYVGSHMNNTATGSQFIPYKWSSNPTEPRASEASGSMFENSSEWRSSVFNSLSNAKLESVLNLMRLGYDVLFIDTDIAVTRDPLPHILWSNVDYVHTVNKPCSG
jgi:hypothetical protein